MIRGAVFPHSFGGMVGAVMLGLGRAMGETIAVALIIGAATQITPNVFASGNALPAVIVLNWGDPGVPPGRSALIGLRRGAVRHDHRHQLRGPHHRAAGRDPDEGSRGVTTLIPTDTRADEIPAGLRRATLSHRRRVIDSVAKVADLALRSWSP